MVRSGVFKMLMYGGFKPAVIFIAQNARNINNRIYLLNLLKYQQALHLSQAS